ncbi:hypothetical protein ACGFIW_01265 [Micromonospora sp. NPDC048935]|uniref:hypothetical protein n=1 Tax=Micromonospora sp. NPDC048935 TaxID=3364262 RepID=UPI00371DABF1
MSRVYFHSPSGDAELRGSERAWLRSLARGPAETAWGLDPQQGIDRVRDILALVSEVPDGLYGANYLHTYLRDAEAQEQANKRVYAGWQPGQPLAGPTSHEPQQRLINAVRVALRVDGLRMVVADVELHTTNVDLNTALVAGSDAVRVAAKVDGWCESHCWVEGPDRAWLADIIDQGLTAGLYRRGLWYSNTPDGPKDQWSDQGWGQVTGLLRSRDDEPVVLSYSVCDQFPNPEIAGHELSPDQWYDLPRAEQWQTAMDGLRRDRPWARLAPDTLAEVTFGLPVTVYDLFAPDRDDRVRAAAHLVDA